MGDEDIDENALRAQMAAAFDRIKAEPERAEPAASADAGVPELRPGRIVAVSGNEVFVDLGPRTQGVIPLAEFDAAPQAGEQFEFSMVGVKDGLWTLSRHEARLLATWRELEVGREVKAQVTGQNAGGLELKVGPVAAFMPFSEVALERITDFAPYLGQSLMCEVLEVAPNRRRVVLSRRRVLQREQRAARERMRATLVVGRVLRGRIERIEPYGAFVDLGGVSGLLHVSNISHQRIADPAKVLSIGQEVEVQILELKEGGERIGLGMKQLQADPWVEAGARLQPDQMLRGKVVRITDFGAFIELEPGVEGLLHRSQLAPSRVRAIEDVVKVGDQVTVRVLAVDPAARRIQLSRLTARGAVIGSEEELSLEEVREHLAHDPAVKSATTNLGALLKAALEKQKPR
ncbi:MAG: S1 RNA-binding domain-containing protein [Planctomycetota bacterium]